MQRTVVPCNAKNVKEVRLGHGKNKKLIVVVMSDIDSAANASTHQCFTSALNVEAVCKARELPAERKQECFS